MFTEHSPVFSNEDKEAHGINSAAALCRKFFGSPEGKNRNLRSKKYVKKP